MRFGGSFFLLPVAAASILLTSCSSVNVQSASGSGPGSNPAKTTPVIAWSQPAAIDDTTPLGSAQLDATANVNGKFAYTPAGGTVLAAGSHTLSVAFTPEDTSKYNAASMSVTIQVNGASQPAGNANCSGGARQGAGDFVYVSTGVAGSGNYQIAGFAPGADGSLTPAAGSPFASQGIAPLAIDGSGPVLFGTDHYTLYSYAVDGEGCLSLESSLAIGQGDPSNPTIYVRGFQLDAGKTSLYANDYDPGAQQALYMSYSYDPNTGVVAQTGASAEGGLNGSQLAVDSSGRYAVTSGCSYWGGIGISAFQLTSDGGMTAKSPGSMPFPEAQPGYYWCSYGASADKTDHVVIPMAPCADGGPCFTTGTWQLATYAIDASGKMTPLNNWQTMPTLDMFQTPDMSPSSYEFSPDDRYFAVSGYTGLEVFAWDSGNAVLTHVASLQGGSCTYTPSGGPQCKGDGFGNVAWDSNDRLYTYKGNQLLVYAVTDAGIVQAPGSPYAVQNPQSVTVVREHAQ
jgi:hypothetical protein